MNKFFKTISIFLTIFAALLFFAGCFSDDNGGGGGGGDVVTTSIDGVWKMDSLEEDGNPVPISGTGTVAYSGTIYLSIDNQVIRVYVDITLTAPMPYTGMNYCPTYDKSTTIDEVNNTMKVTDSGTTFDYTLSGDNLTITEGTKIIKLSKSNTTAIAAAVENCTIMAELFKNVELF
ncbi:MAG: hypothetical protein GY754_10485 [bacterium]|nr:hypothetical protein [bacterium]